MHLGEGMRLTIAGGLTAGALWLFIEFMAWLGRDWQRAVGTWSDPADDSDELRAEALCPELAADHNRILAAARGILDRH